MSLVRFRRRRGKYGLEHAPRTGLKIHNILFSFKLPWKILDEVRFHSFNLRMEVSDYIRKALILHNARNARAPLTPEQREQLNDIGGWPTQELQEQRKKQRLNYLGSPLFKTQLYLKKEKPNGSTKNES